MKKKFTLILLSFLFFTTSVIKGDESLSFTINESTTTHNLGVTYISGIGEVTNDQGVKTRQDYNVFVQEENIKVVNWSKFYNGNYMKDTTLEIAKDFELKNPKYEVIAGVNGDYFIDETVNANVAFGNRVIKPENHSKYDSLEFNFNGKLIDKHKNLYMTDDYFLSIYDEDILKGYKQLTKLNSNNLVSGETTIFLKNSNILPDEKTSYYNLKMINNHQNGRHIYFESEINLDSNNNDYVLATKDNNLISILKDEFKIILQTEIKEVSYGNMVIGYDNNMLVNNDILEFSQMDGQNHANNTNRHPRTGFGYTEDGKFVLITVDGRGVSKGVDLREFSKIMKTFNIIEGFNLDGGGSTQAIYRKDGKLQVVNNASEKNPYRKVGNALFFVREKGEIANFEYKKNSAGFEFELDEITNEFNIEVTINGIKETYTNKTKISYNDLEQNTSLNIKLINGNKIQTILNDVINQNKDKFVPKNAEVLISHIYKDGELEFQINYEDPYKTISSVRVYFDNYNLDYPAMVEYQGLRIARFGKLNIKGNNEVRVIVSYNNMQTKEYVYEFKIKEDKNYGLVILMTLATITIGMSIIVIKIIKNKR